MNMRKSMAESFAIAVLVTGSAWAQHNMSAAFDLNQRFTETGTLTQLDWRNPHIYVSVDVASEEGQIATWSRGSFRRARSRAKPCWG